MLTHLINHPITNMFTVQPSASLRTLILLPYFLLLITGLMIPSDGSHGILNIKSMAFVGTVFSVSLYLFISHKLNLSQWKIILFLFCSVIFLTVWVAISLVYGETHYDSTMEHLKVFWLTISVVVITLFLFYTGLVSFSEILITVLYTNFLYSALKSTLVVLHLMNVITIWPLLETLGVRYMSMDILLGVPRLQTSIDIATPFLLLFFLQGKQFGMAWSKKFKILYLVISTFAIFLSFSRFLSFIALLSFVLHVMTLRSRQIWKAFPLFLIGCGLGIAWVGFDNIYTILERRLYSVDNYASDYARMEQMNALMEEYYQFPFLGKGLGGYATNSIRDSLLPYSYEVQWLATLMQFGLFGIMLLFIPLGLIGAKILSLPLTKSKVAFFVLFVSWLLAGFTNPFLISLTSGILYSLFLLAGISMSTEQVYTSYKI